MSKHFRLVLCLFCVVGLMLVASPAAATTDLLQAVADATLIEFPPGNIPLANGSGRFFHAGNTDQGASSNTRRALIRFDIASTIPPASTITDVTLTLNMSRNQSDGSARATSLHAVTRDWAEGPSDAPGNEGVGADALPGDVTWFHTVFDTALWTNPGGDFVAAASASTNVGSAEGFYSWTGPGMVADVQAWLDDPASDFGWLLLSVESTAPTARRYDSRQNPDFANRPVLSVTYTSASACGNGEVESGEDCDGGECCTKNCTFVAAGTSCDDGLFCNVGETCNAAGMCGAGAANPCSDGVKCTVDSCNEATDSCANSPNDAACDDSQFCNGAETCEASVGCQPGSDPCPGQECNEANDSCGECQLDADCDDNQFCNGAEICVGGLCRAGTPACDDGDICTDDMCDDCTQACDNIPDQSNDPSCSAAVCGNGEVEQGEDCDGGECCTKQCTFAPGGASCDDGSVCNVGETCDDVGICRGGAVDCNNNECASDPACVADCDIDVMPLALDFGKVVPVQESTKTDGHLVDLLRRLRRLGNRTGNRAGRASSAGGTDPTVTLPVTLGNAGGSICEVSDLVLTGSPEFTVNPATPGVPILVLPGQSVDVLVDYTPVDVGSDSGTLAVFSNDPDENPVNVTLTGSSGFPSTGEVLYQDNCGFCHGVDPWSLGPAPAAPLKVPGSRPCTIRRSIYGGGPADSVFPDGVPDMTFLQGNLSREQVLMIAEFLNSRATSGRQRYITNCSGCHGFDAAGGRVDENVRGEDASEVREAIFDEEEMEFLRCLPRSDTRQIGDYLSRLSDDDDDSDDEEEDDEEEDGDSDAP